ncbi:hypothetical protein [uncultured Rhodoblastus sp.]|uniref:hypothetical protein n=1 Tax=uncultured Rhodoblastus sp. TaxID=543037 RepID=UPI0025E9632F|nr:hypothetical protein [uncultured Rhodoblastus sp.]
MRGTRYGNVSIVGFINYRRGHMEIIYQDGLRESACECRDVVKAHNDEFSITQLGGY